MGTRRSDDSQGAESADRAGDAVNCERGQKHGNFGQPGRDGSQGECGDGGGHHQLHQGHDDDVRGQSDGGGAMEVVRHGESESHLHDGGDEEQFPCGEGQSDSRADHAVRPLLSHEEGDACGDELQVDTELGHTRGKLCGVVVGVPVGERLLLELGGALQDRNPDSGDDEHADEGHLEAGSEKLARVDDQQSQGGCAQRVDHGAIAVEQARSQVDGAH